MEEVTGAKEVTRVEESTGAVEEDGVLNDMIFEDDEEGLEAVGISEVVKGGVCMDVMETCDSVLEDEVLTEREREVIDRLGIRGVSEVVTEVAGTGPKLGSG